MRYITYQNCQKMSRVEIKFVAMDNTEPENAKLVARFPLIGGPGNGNVGAIARLPRFVTWKGKDLAIGCRASKIPTKCA